MDPDGSGWILMGLNEYLWVWMDSEGPVRSLDVPMDSDGFRWIMMGSDGSWWVTMSFIN